MHPIIRTLTRRKPLVSALFVITLTLTTIFGFKAFFYLTYWQDDQRLRPIASWMTPRYIARTWELDRDDVYEVLGLDEGDRQSARRPLVRLAMDLDTTPMVLIDALHALIEEEYGEPPS